MKKKIAVLGRCAVYAILCASSVAPPRMADLDLGEPVVQQEGIKVHLLQSPVSLLYSIFIAPHIGFYKHVVYRRTVAHFSQALLCINPHEGEAKAWIGPYAPV